MAEYSNNKYRTQTQHRPRWISRSIIKGYLARTNTYPAITSNNRSAQNSGSKQKSRCTRHQTENIYDKIRTGAQIESVNLKPIQRTSHVTSWETRVPAATGAESGKYLRHIRGSQGRGRRWISPACLRWLFSAAEYLPLLSFSVLRDDKVSMLTHTCPDKPIRKIEGVICNHQVDIPFYWCLLLLPSFPFQYWGMIKWVC